MNKISFNIERELTEEEKQAVEIVKTLQEKGFEAYFAGGAVRDEILGIPAHDIDIATSAKPEEVQKIFPGARGQGKAFGVVVVKSEKSTSTKGGEFEVATFRSDIGIADHRRPIKIEYTTAEEDAQRRDFTINGLFYDPVKFEIIDYVEGIKDLKRKIIRFIGKPEERIEEDYLRMLRAVRFAAKYNFKLEAKSKKAVKENTDKIIEISAERIRDEVSKSLQIKNRDQSILLWLELGLLDKILPELKATKNVSQPVEFHGEGDVWTHTLLALKNIGNPPDGGPSEELVGAVLLHDIAKPETIGYRSKIGKTSITFFDHDVRSAEKAKAILERLKFSHHFIEAVFWAISQHMRIINAFSGMSERKQKKLFSDPHIKLLLDLTKADLSASLRPIGKPDMKMYEDALALHKKFEKETSEEEKHQVKKFDLITGNDIMKELKLEPGPEVGKIKTEIEKAYLDGKINSRADAIKMLEKYKK